MLLTSDTMHLYQSRLFSHCILCTGSCERSEWNFLRERSSLIPTPPQQYCKCSKHTLTLIIQPFTLQNACNAMHLCSLRYTAMRVYMCLQPSNEHLYISTRAIIHTLHNVMQYCKYLIRNKIKHIMGNDYAWNTSMYGSFFQLHFIQVKQVNVVDISTLLIQ